MKSKEEEKKLKASISRTKSDAKNVVTKRVIVKKAVKIKPVVIHPAKPEVKVPQKTKVLGTKIAPKKSTSNIHINTSLKVDPSLGTPRIITPNTNLPPVAGQGKTAKAHAEWKKTHVEEPAKDAPKRSTIKGVVGGVNANGQRGKTILRRKNDRPTNNANGGPRRPFTRPARPDFKKTEAAPVIDVNAGKKRTFNKKKKDDYSRKDVLTEEKTFELKKKMKTHANSVPKSIDIMDVITVSDLAKKMNLKAAEIISKLFEMGSMVTINQQIDSDTAQIIASEYNCEVNIVSLYDETLIASEEDKEEDLIPRAPIVTVMGHVDHGKTKTLDAIRNTNVISGEFGGITQHIGAYKVNVGKNKDIVFLDTPGHAAFTMMRARGAKLTDIVVLVVAANDGVMPQTIEAIDHAKAADVPIIVAINKCDLPDANVDRVKQQLSDRNLMPEEWGGSTLYCEISALKNQGIDNLLDQILLQAEVLELKANANKRAEGNVIESRIDQGRGTVATVIIQSGTLKVGDSYLAGIYPGRVRAMFDDKGRKIESAGPSTPVEIIGLSDIPGAGDPFQVTENEKQAKQIGAKRQELERLGANKSSGKLTLEFINNKIKEEGIKSFNVIIKGDVQGSVEALEHSLKKLGNDEVKLNVIRASAGAIIESDVSLAMASNALIIGFNVRPTPKAATLADQEKIEIRKYNVIYNVVDDIRDALEGLLDPDVSEVEVGKAEVRAIFKIPKVGLIAGCYVLEGFAKRNCLCNVIRDNIKIHEGKISSLKREKNEAAKVNAGYECGIGLENYHDLKENDILEFVERVETKRKLEVSERI